MRKFTTGFFGVTLLLYYVYVENQKPKKGCFLKIPTKEKKKRKGKLNKKKALTLISSFLSCL